MLPWYVVLHGCRTSRNKSPNKSPALDPRSTRGRSPAVGERNKSPAVGAHGSRGSTPRGTSTPRGSATSSERVEVREKVGEKPSSRAAVPPQYTQSPSAKDAARPHLAKAAAGRSEQKLPQLGAECSSAWVDVVAIWVQLLLSRRAPMISGYAHVCIRCADCMTPWHLQSSERLRTSE